MRVNVPSGTPRVRRAFTPPWRVGRSASRLTLAAVVVALAATALPAQSAARITSPKEFFGFNIGDDWKLANYDQFMAYWRKIDAESDRMVVEEIGKTAEGRPQLMAIITSPENFKNLARYKEIARRLALAEGLTDEQARELAREGKAVVWFDGGLHATEVLGAHQLLETTYQLVSRNDPETMRILNDDIILAVHANPDGMQLVSNWYMQNADTLKRNMAIPRLYQKYIGHDNNRDFYILNQPESVNIARIQYHEWFPHIVYNHHQTGPAGTVMFAPPFRDPFNYNFDPMIPIGIDMVGAAMHERFLREGKPGVTSRTGANYSTWWNGGLRTTVYFHNMIGLLTETIGNPTPMEIPLIVRNQLPRGDLPSPIAPQKWHFRQSIDYSVTANYAVFDIASKRREDFLFNIYRMGKNSIERGSRDTWTVTPHNIDSLNARAERERAAARGAGQGGGGGGGGFGAQAAPSRFFAEYLRNPAHRDPRGYILPANQPDFLTATKFVNALRKVNVTVHRATAPFTVAGKNYPAGSYVVKTAQAFRPHVIDMFEPQDHPNDFAYPGGPPRPPYDNAGYTLAYQMGLQFDRILDGFDCPCEVITGIGEPPTGTIANANAPGFLVSHAANDAFVAVNRALKNGNDVYWLRSTLSANGKTYPAGTFYIASKSGTPQMLQALAKEKGVSFEGTTVRPGADALKLQPKRIALWDQYGGSMPSGHTRWLLEQFEFPYQVVYPQGFDAGNLSSKYDVLVFHGGAIPSANPERQGGFGGRGRNVDPATIPAEFRGWLGRLTADKSIPHLKKFLEDGGTIITIGSSTDLAYHLGLPVSNHLVEKTPAGETEELPREKFYVPGSVMRVAVDNTSPVAAGMPSSVDVFFDESPVFRLQPDAVAKGVRPVAWFDSPHSLRSGWAWGQAYLDGGVTVAEATVGKGKLYLFGPEINFRGQSHGTFKFLFNGIYAGSAADRGRTDDRVLQDR
ncbi:MAG TPA: M14 family zinc carboxypeptidase [Gemmatimonadaceae bacterium]|nr:M14 family zinc carboxypeptidase [Gemmatimonadaceae bacterium]